MNEEEGTNGMEKEVGKKEKKGERKKLGGNWEG